MARLVVVNGAPGSGKSTLARQYVQDHPLALALDVDVVRSMLGGSLDQPQAAGMAARAMALAMARVHLCGGNDVVVPQYLGRMEFVLELERLAADCAVVFVEVALLADVPDLIDRVTRRSQDGARPEHVDAARLLVRSGGAAEIGRSQQRLLDVIARRPTTVVIRTAPGRVGAAYDELLRAIGGPPGQI